MCADDSSHFDGEPTYEQLKSGELGHVEVLQITFDGRKLTYEELCKFFFEVHDSTTFGYQGDDIGQQYQSIIFYHSLQQETTAESLKR